AEDRGRVRASGSEPRAGELLGLLRGLLVLLQRTPLGQDALVVVRDADDLAGVAGGLQAALVRRAELIDRRLACGRAVRLDGLSRTAQFSDCVDNVLLGIVHDVEHLASPSPQGFLT